MRKSSTRGKGSPSSQQDHMCHEINGDRSDSSRGDREPRASRFSCNELTHKSRAWKKRVVGELGTTTPMSGRRRPDSPLQLANTSAEEGLLACHYLHPGQGFQPSS